MISHSQLHACTVLPLAAEAYESGEYVPNLGWSKSFFLPYLPDHDLLRSSNFATMAT